MEQYEPHQFLYIPIVQPSTSHQLDVLIQFHRLLDLISRIFHSAVKVVYAVGFR